MRKQTDFVVRVFKLGNGTGDTWTSEMLNQYTHENYLSKGYEVFSASVAQIFANEVFFNVNFVKYEDVDTSGLTYLENDTKTINVKSK